MLLIFGVLSESLSIRHQALHEILSWLKSTLDRSDGHTTRAWQMSVTVVCLDLGKLLRFLLIGWSDQTSQVVGMEGTSDPVQYTHTTVTFQGPVLSSNHLFPFNLPTSSTGCPHYQTQKESRLHSFCISLCIIFSVPISIAFHQGHPGPHGRHSRVFTAMNSVATSTRWLSATGL